MSPQPPIAPASRVPAEFTVTDNTKAGTAAASKTANAPILQTATPLASSSIPTASSSSTTLAASNSKTSHTFIIAIIVVLSLLLIALVAFTFWRRPKARPSSSSSGLQRNRPSSSSPPEPTSTSTYSSLSKQPNSAGKSTRGLLLGSIKEESVVGSKEYLNDPPRRSSSSFEEVRWETPKVEEDQGYGNEIRRWGEGEEGVVMGTAEYNYGHLSRRGGGGGEEGRGGEGRGKGRADEGAGVREELPPSFEDARRGGAGVGVYEVLEDRKMLIPERG